MKEGAIDDLINGHTEEGDEQRREQDRAIVAGPLYLQSLGILTLLTLLPFPAIYHSSIFVACVTMRSLFLRLLTLLSLLRKMSVEYIITNVTVNQTHMLNLASSQLLDS